MIDYINVRPKADD